MRLDREEGFTLIELLVAIGLFAIVSVAFYTAMFSGVQGGNTTRSVVQISAEARNGFNRMVRDTREAQRLLDATATSYNVRVDFNGDGNYDNPTAPNPGATPPYAGGDFENLTFRYDASDGTIRLNDQVLMAGVRPINGEVFGYSSNILEYDWNGDGVTEWRELDVAPTRGVSGVGNNNGVLDSAEWPFISSVHYSIRVTEGERTSDFFTEAELRNRL